MVMEAPPSPDSVGREFVRQYYTLLNKAPTHLHRFYNNQSSFVHGGLDPPNRATSPMIGQKQIHQKIQQLNFRDCHAKISQVDAQATLGNGVVVQVTGELSNAGQPMRRFTQTFVLAAQSPKKYYVHNDIFRYQDEIISDEECEQDSRSDLEEDMNNQERPTMPEIPPIAQQQPITYYTPNAAPPLQGTLPPVPPHHHAQPPPPHVIPAQPAPAINGAVHPDDMPVMPGQVPQHVAPAQGPGIGPTIANLPTVAQTPIPAPAPIEESQQPVEEASVEPPVENSYTDEQPAEPEVVEVPQETTTSSNEPKTYATLLKSGGNSSGGYASTGPSLPAKTISPPPNNRFDHRDQQNMSGSPSEPMGQRNNVNRTNKVQPRMPRQESRGPGRNSINDDNEGVFEERRRSQGNPQFNDSNQLFLGNLPHNATDDELKEIFSQFGTIVDLRIHNKPGNKSGPPGSRTPLNYGFITYENQQFVQNCLAAKAIYYPNNDKNGTRLNVQEKKTKDRPSYGGGVGGGRPSMENNGGPRPRDNGQRRGLGGPGQARGGGNMAGNGGSRPNSFNRGPPNRGPNNTFSNRR